MLTIISISVLIIYFYTNSNFSMNTLLEVNKVVKQYGDCALNSFINSSKGSIYFRSKWCWKTSLIRIINQITLPDSGSIILDGENCSPNMFNI
jgi:ABC-2 type transport system ATP-binding protein